MRTASFRVWRESLVATSAFLGFFGVACPSAAQQELPAQPAAPQPSAAAPATPVAPAPIMKDPVAKPPAAKDPVAKPPAAKQPAAKQPAAKQPAAKQPVAKQPVAKQPVANNSAAQESPAKQPARSEAQIWFDSKVLLTQASVGAMLLFDKDTDRMAPVFALSAGPIVSNWALSAELAWMGVHLDEDADEDAATCPDCDVVNVFALSLNPQYLCDRGSWVLSFGGSAGLVYTAGWRKQEDGGRGAYHPAGLHPQVGARVQLWNLLGERGSTESEAWRGQQIIARAIRYEELCRAPSEVSAQTCAAEAKLLARLANETYPLPCSIGEVQVAADGTLAEPQISELQAYGRCLEMSSDVDRKQSALSFGVGLHLSLDGAAPAVAVPLTAGIVF